MSSPDAVISLRNAVLQRGNSAEQFRVVADAFDVIAGEAIALVGDSGSGKSTFLEFLGLLFHPEHVDEWVFRGRGTVIDLKKFHLDKDEKEFARLRSTMLSFIPQTGGLMPFLSLRENIRLPRKLIGEKIDTEAEIELLQSLGIEDVIDRMPKAVSIGQRQRAAIARAVFAKPNVILADEPTSALDPETSRTTLDMLIRFAGMKNKSVVIVSHEHQLIEKLGLKRYCMAIDPAAPRVANVVLELEVDHV